MALCEDNTSLVVDGVSTNIGDPLTIGLSGTNNSLIVKNAGSITNTTGMIGKQITADQNFAIITNAGSAWINTEYLYVGEFGAENQLFIADGGKVKATLGLLVGFNNTTADINTNGDATIKADVQIANLVVQDPKTP